jgi:hypothetical protein
MIRYLAERLGGLLRAPPSPGSGMSRDANLGGANGRIYNTIPTTHQSRGIMNNNARDITYPSTRIGGRSSVEGLGLGVRVRAGAGDGGHRLLQCPQFGRLRT